MNYSTQDVYTTSIVSMETLKRTRGEAVVVVVGEAATGASSSWPKCSATTATSPSLCPSASKGMEATTSPRKGHEKEKQQSQQQQHRRPRRRSFCVGTTSTTNQSSSNDDQVGLTEQLVQMILGQQYEDKFTMKESLEKAMQRLQVMLNSSNNDYAIGTPTTTGDNQNPNSPRLIASLTTLLDQTKLELQQAHCRIASLEKSNDAVTGGSTMSACHEHDESDTRRSFDRRHSATSAASTPREWNLDRFRSNNKDEAGTDAKDSGSTAQHSASRRNSCHGNSSSSTVLSQAQLDSDAARYRQRRHSMDHQSASSTSAASSASTAHKIAALKANLRNAEARNDKVGRRLSSTEGKGWNRDRYPRRHSMEDCPLHALHSPHPVDTDSTLAVIRPTLSKAQQITELQVCLQNAEAKMHHAEQRLFDVERALADAQNELQSATRQRQLQQMIKQTSDEALGETPTVSGLPPKVNSVSTLQSFLTAESSRQLPARNDSEHSKTSLVQELQSQIQLLRDEVSTLKPMAHKTNRLNDDTIRHLEVRLAQQETERHAVVQEMKDQLMRAEATIARLRKAEQQQAQPLKCIDDTADDEAASYKQFAKTLLEESLVAANQQVEKAECTIQQLRLEIGTLEPMARETTRLHSTIAQLEARLVQYEAGHAPTTALPNVQIDTANNPQQAIEINTAPAQDSLIAHIEYKQAAEARMTLLERALAVSNECRLEAVHRLKNIELEQSRERQGGSSETTIQGTVSEHTTTCMTEELNALKLRADELAWTKQDLEATITRQAALCAEQELDLQAAKAEAASLRSELGASVNSSRDTEDRLRQAMAELDRERLELLQQVDLTRSQATDAASVAQHRYDEICSQAQIREQEIAMAELELQAAKAEAASLRSELDASINSSRDTEDRLQQAMAELDCERLELLQQVDLTCSQATDAASAAQHRYDDMCGQLQIREQEIAMAEATADILRDSLASAETTIEELRRDLKSAVALAPELEEAQQNLRDTQALLEAQTQRANEARLEVEALQAELQQSQGVVEQLRAQASISANKDDTDQVSSLIAERDKLLSTVEHLTTKVTALEDESDQREVLINNLVNRDGSEVASIELYVVCLQNEQKRTLERCTDLSIKLAESRFKIDELTDKLYKYEEQKSSVIDTSSKVQRRGSLQTMVNNGLDRLNTHLDESRRNTEEASTWRTKKWLR